MTEYEPFNFISIERMKRSSHEELEMYILEMHKHAKALTSAYLEMRTSLVQFRRTSEELQKQLDELKLRWGSLW